MLISSCNQFVKDSIGEKYLSTGTFDLKEIYEESTAKTPLIFILSPSKIDKLFSVLKTVHIMIRLYVLSKIKE